MRVVSTMPSTALIFSARGRVRRPVLALRVNWGALHFMNQNLSRPYGDPQKESSWQAGPAMIHYGHGTGWEADDPKG